MTSSGRPGLRSAGLRSVAREHTVLGGDGILLETPCLALEILGMRDQLEALALDGGGRRLARAAGIGEQRVGPAKQRIFRDEQIHCATPWRGDRVLPACRGESRSRTGFRDGNWKSARRRRGQRGSIRLSTSSYMGRRADPDKGLGQGTIWWTVVATRCKPDAIRASFPGGPG